MELDEMSDSVFEIETMSDGWLIFELTGDASYLSDDEILAELTQ